MPSETFIGVTLARVVRPHGIRGELTCEILTDFPQRLSHLRKIWLWDGRTGPRLMNVVRCRLTGGRTPQALFQLAGITTRNDAERLRGCEIQVPLAERMPLAAGRYYVTDLVGCGVFEGAAFVGTVRDVRFTGKEVSGTPLLVVDTPRGEMLVPLAFEICTRIDTAARRIEVALPEGLRELN